MKKRRLAFLSLYTKGCLQGEAAALDELGFDFLATHGTAEALVGHGFKVTDVADLIGHAPAFEHRVASMSWEVATSILAPYSANEELEKMGLRPIDLIYVRPYPTQEAAVEPDATWESIREMIDIGGPTSALAGSKAERIVIFGRDNFWRTIEWIRNGEINRQNYLRMLANTNLALIGWYYIHASNYLGRHKLQ